MPDALPDGPVFRLVVVAPLGAAHVRHLENYPDRFLLVEGESVAAEFPDDAAYRFSPDFPDDLGLESALYNLDKQLVVQDPLCDLLAARLGDDVEMLPVTVYDHRGRAVGTPYTIVNMLRHVDAVDQDATTFSWNALDETAMIGVQNLTVDPARVPDDAQLFRLVHVTGVIGVRRALAEALVAGGFTGLSFVPFADYRG